MYFDFTKGNHQADEDQTQPALEREDRPHGLSATRAQSQQAGSTTPMNEECRDRMDVCATRANAKCAAYFTKNQDGLKQAWRRDKVHWMNAPCSGAAAWAKKADQAGKAGAVVVGLFANRSATAWYRDHVVHRQWWSSCMVGWRSITWENPLPCRPRRLAQSLRFGRAKLASD
jgi:DNA N-6-adenine-methyltransferase (Dam)